MIFSTEKNALVYKRAHETVRIEGWGENALRVRATKNASFSKEDWALGYGTSHAEVTIGERESVIRNGKISATVTNLGNITFYRDGKRILNEFYRSYDIDTPHSPSLKYVAREFRPNGEDYTLSVRFESDDDEQIYGMGQYQDGYFNLKGCSLELAQRNSQVSIPFYISNKGYGFLWNNPAVGNCTFGKNKTEWRAERTRDMDYWIVADDTPKKIEKIYTSVVGRSPVMPENVLGLWQCKLRYRTQEEVIAVAREYARRGVKLDVIVIDFFHWTRQGDFRFDPVYWPDPKEMCDELKKLGVRCMVSIWPTVDRKSENYAVMQERGLLVRTEKGSPQCFDFLGDTVIYDATNPEARQFIWDVCKRNYQDFGIDMYWLDEAEPEYAAYDFDHFRYHIGSVLRTGNIYPRLHAKAFYEGQTAAGQKDICNLLRSAWVGSQKYATVVWSGDVYGNFQSLRDQFAAGLNMGIAGIPWWTTDIAGFFADTSRPGYKELLLRWFEYSVYCPVLRMHGDKGPFMPTGLDDRDWGGGMCHSGLPNEIWSFGEDVYEVLKGYCETRENMKPYLMRLNREAARNGSPLMRPMFYEFPDDPECWKAEWQYMLGDKLLVAPVLEEGAREKTLYLPAGKWKAKGKVYEGGRWITVDAPLEYIPVFEKM